MDQRARKRIRYRQTQENELSEGQYNRYFLEKFSKEARRCLHPYSLIDNAQEIREEKPKTVLGINSTCLVVEAKSKQQAENLQRLTEVEEFNMKPCYTQDLIARRD